MTESLNTFTKQFSTRSARVTSNSIEEEGRCAEYYVGGFRFRYIPSTLTEVHW